MTDRRQRQIAWIARGALALVFIWHGLVPKILWLSAGELAMIQAHGLLAPEWLALLLDVALFSPHLLLQAFNPLSTNLAALALCWLAWLAESEPEPQLH